MRLEVFDLSDNHVGVDELDFDTQRLVSHHFSLIDGEWQLVSMPFRSVSPAELEDVLAARPEHVALRLVGPGVADFLRAETGCHVRRTLAAGPEIVRVQVLGRVGFAIGRRLVEAHRIGKGGFKQVVVARGQLAHDVRQSAYLRGGQVG